jgi:predicted enzyme related to lactoylglutathione lyase
MISFRTCIDVDDLDRGIAFYSAALGLTPGRRLGKGWAELTGASGPIDLLANAAGTKPTSRSEIVRAYERHWTPVHLDFVVDDIESAVQRCVSAGATLERPIATKPYGKIAILADPFGNGFCLLEFRGRGYDELLGG